MSNALAIPQQPEEPPFEQKAIQCLTGCLTTSQSLKISRSTSGAWSLAPSDGLRAAELRAGLAALDELLAAGPKKRISAAIIELLAATDRPPSLGDAAALTRTEALKQMAWDYPINVIETACRDWRKVPNFGRWWPAEQDLRALCEKIAKPHMQFREEAASLLRYLERREQGNTRQRAAQPFGKTLAFHNDCMASFGPAYCRSYISTRTCDFSDDTIFTMGIVADHLNKTASLLLAKHGVKAVRCPHTTERVYADEDARAGDRPAPRKRSHQ